VDIRFKTKNLKMDVEIPIVLLPLIEL